MWCISTQTRRSLHCQVLLCTQQLPLLRYSTSALLLCGVQPKARKSSLRSGLGSHTLISVTTPLERKPLASASAICPAPRKPILLSNCMTAGCFWLNALSRQLWRDAGFSFWATTGKLDNWRLLNNWGLLNSACDLCKPASMRKWDNGIRCFNLCYQAWIIINI